MTHDQFLIEHGSNTGGHGVEYQPRREVFGNGNLHMTVIGRLDQIVNVFRSPAELGNNKSRGLVQFDNTLQGPGDIFGAHRIAGVKPKPRANLEGDSFAILADIRALGYATNQGLQILWFEHHDSIVNIGDDLTSGELEHFSRIHGDYIGKVLGHNKGITRRCSLG